MITNKAEYIPYKDSKLTRVLQDSLGGSNKTTIIINCSPHIYHAEDSILSLKFGTRAKKIKNNVRPNTKIAKDHLEDIISQLRTQLNEANDQIDLLKTMLKKTKTKINYNNKSKIIDKRAIDSINFSRISNVFEGNDRENSMMSKDNNVAKRMNTHDISIVETIVENEEERCRNAECTIYIDSLLKQIDNFRTNQETLINQVIL